MKTLLTVSILEKAGATALGKIKNADWFNGEPAREVLSEPGFYFLVNPGSYTTARFYVGRQRSKCGFSNVLSQLNRGRSQLGRTLRSNDVIYDVFFVPVSKMKVLTTGYNKGQLSLMFTKSHKEAFQNLEEINRMLNDNFLFGLQSY